MSVVVDRISHKIWTLRGLISEAWCAEQIAFAEDEGFAEAPVTTLSGMVMRPEYRNNTRVMVDDAAAAEALSEQLRPYLPERFGNGAYVGLNERLRYYRYDPGQFFKGHYDGCFRRDDEECSEYTVMVYLNGGFAGGETAFRFHSVKPEPGLVLIFEHATWHEGRTLLAGRKYVLRTDAMYRVAYEY